jgi:hypothetical protein
MKILAILSVVFISFHVWAVTASQQLNPTLLPVFESLISKSESNELIGQVIAADLSLKFASEKHLIFYDAYLDASDGSKYQIAKWHFDINTIREVIGKYDTHYKVTFKITGVVNHGLNKNMPYIEAEIISISEQ